VTTVLAHLSQITVLRADERDGEVARDGDRDGRRVDIAPSDGGIP